MSKLNLTINPNRLNAHGLDDTDYSLIVIEFVVGVKQKLAKYLASNYNVSYKQALEIIKIHDLQTHYTVGIDDPVVYDGKIKEAVQNILMYDLGSFTLKIKPSFILKRGFAEFESSLAIIWSNYLARRKRGDDSIE